MLYVCQVLMVCHGMSSICVQCSIRWTQDVPRGILGCVGRVDSRIRMKMVELSLVFVSLLI